MSEDSLKDTQRAASPMLELQLRLLEKEIDIVNQTIRQGDDITKSIKEWSILVWAGSVGGALTADALRPYVWATAAIPLLFWLVDSWHRATQRSFIWRGLRIMDFLNDERLDNSFRQGRISGFTLMDIGSRRDRDEKYGKFVDWRRVMLFKTLSFLYIGLAAMSIVLWIMNTFWNPS